MSDILSVAKEVNRSLKKIAESMDNNNKLVEQILEGTGRKREDSDGCVVAENVSSEMNNSLVHDIKPHALRRLMDLIKYRGHGERCDCELCHLWNTEFDKQYQQGIIITRCSNVITGDVHSGLNLE